MLRQVVESGDRGQCAFRWSALWVFPASRAILWGGGSHMLVTVMAEKGCLKAPGNGHDIHAKRRR